MEFSGPPGRSPGRVRTGQEAGDRRTAAAPPPASWAEASVSPSRQRIVRIFGIVSALAMLSGENPAAPIHFSYRPIGFRLENCETLRRHAPETMAGGVAI